MELKYIKINEKKIELSDGITYISADNDSGKSSLVYLIKFILGGKDKLYGDKNFFDDYKKYKSINPSVLLEWKIDEKIYKYDMTGDTFSENNNVITVESYNEKYKQIVNIFGNEVNINNQIYLPDNSVLKKFSKQVFFPNNNYSYNAFFIYYLVTGKNLEELEIYNYFSEIAKMKRMSASAAKIKTQLTKELSDQEVAEYTSIHNMYFELGKLKKLKHEIPDQKIISEMKSIVKNDDIIKRGIRYHKALVNDYNSIIDLEKRRIEHEIEKMSGENIVDDILHTYSVFIQNTEKIKARQKKEINKRSEEIKTENFYKEFLEEVNEINVDIQNFVAFHHSKLFNENYKYDTKFEIPENIESLVFSFASKDNPGDGSRQANYILFMVYLLNNSELFNYFVMDTTINNEIDGKIIKLNKIIMDSLQPSKKVICFLHPNNALAKDQKIKYNYNKSNPIFIKLKK